VQKLQGLPAIGVLQHQIQRPLPGLTILKRRHALEVIAQPLGFLAPLQLVQRRDAGLDSGPGARRGLHRLSYIEQRQGLSNSCRAAGWWSR
jgi:hypothetical protein